MLIRNAMLADALGVREGDVLIENGTITAVGKDLQADGPVLDAGGLVLLPAFVDTHCHFRTPGFEYKEDLTSGSRAAARGGLLHDLYLCNWSQTNIGPWKRLLIHPQIALRNAEIHGLSDLEKDIISKHMWPLTLRKVPRHRESVVVNLADKICACTEMLRLYSKIGAAAALAKYNLCKPLFPQSVV